MSKLTRVPESALEFDKSLVRSLTGIPCSNRKQLEIACHALKQVIQNDLTARQKEVILLYYYENLNNKQIAESLQLDASTVCRTLQRAKRKIHKLLDFYMDYLHTVQME